MSTIALDPNPTLAKISSMIGYTGRKYRACPSESVTLNSHWEEGSRDYFYVFETTGGIPNAYKAPQSGTPFDRNAPEIVTITPNRFVIEHSIVCGKDAGLLFHLHPSMIPALLPPPVELSQAESLVLLAAICLKSSYQGMPIRRVECARKGIKGQDYDTALESLKKRGFLNQAGAVTNAGRNAAESLPNRHRAF